MDSSYSESEASSSSDESIREGNVEVELAEDRVHVKHEMAHDEAGPYEDDPVADEEWVKEYKQACENKKKEQLMLLERLEKKKTRDIWCKCGGFCELEHLQNVKECYCCQEIEGCVKSLRCDAVLADMNEPPSCVTLHPGFRVVCLEKWSLRQASDRYKTKAKNVYRQVGSEERFLRSVAYREFTRLIHGRLRNKRIPLPACAYHAIRSKFSTHLDDCTGYEDESDSEGAGEVE